MQEISYREKFFVLGVSLTIAFLSVYSTLASKGTSITLDVPFHKKRIEVTVLGEVKKPGKYFFPKGVSYKEIFRKVRLKRFADIRSYPLKKTVNASKKISIPKKSFLKIFLAGPLINGGWLKVPTGSRVSDLKKKLLIDKNIDTTCLSSRRFLKDEELFFLTFQEKKKQSLEIKSSNIL